MEKWETYVTNCSPALLIHAVYQGFLWGSYGLWDQTDTITPLYPWLF